MNAIAQPRPHLSLVRNNPHNPERDRTRDFFDTLLQLFETNPNISARVRHEVREFVSAGLRRPRLKRVK